MSHACSATRTLRRACPDCVELQRRLGRRLAIAVNVSPLQFQQKDWPAIVAGALQSSGLDSRQLELEITESVLMQSPDGTVRVLRELRQMGVSVAIDDFGTGYSSLAYVTRFPIDKIKIDRSLVRDLTSSTAGAAVVNAIIAMARRLGVRVIAEGVETAELRDRLVLEDCDEAQGFLYSPAVPLAEVGARIGRIERTTRCAPGIVAEVVTPMERAI